jgi:hypothetical protein
LIGRRGIAPLRLVAARGVPGIVDRLLAGRVVRHLLRVLFSGRLEGLPRIALAAVRIRRGLELEILHWGPPGGKPPVPWLFARIAPG